MYKELIIHDQSNQIVCKDELAKQLPEHLYQLTFVSDQAVLGIKTFSKTTLEF